MKAAKVLVVDDELNMRLVLKAMLKKEGYDVVTAADGLEALKILKEEKFAVVATDLKMGLDGMGLLGRSCRTILPAGNHPHRLRHRGERRGRPEEGRLRLPHQTLRAG